MKNIHSFFSAEVLPVNLLLDALVAEDEACFIDLADKCSRIDWHSDCATTSIDHLVLGSAAHPGGQWESFDVDGEDDLALSYTEMLSLPGYAFTHYYKDTYGVACDIPLRPKRYDVARYYAEYPRVVGISDSIMSGATVVSVSRSGAHDFNVQFSHNGSLHNISCRNLVLASGIFESPLKHGLSLQTSTESTTTSQSDLHTSQFVEDESSSDSEASSALSSPTSCSSHTSLHDSCPALIIGTGVSAADAVNRYHSSIHIYKWFDSKGSPCSFRKFPKELYGDYVKVFENMKSAATSSPSSPSTTQSTSQYTGLPNASLLEYDPKSHTARIQLQSGDIKQFQVSKVLRYTGRTSSLSYLDKSVVPDLDTSVITKLSIRSQYRCQLPQIASGVYVMGSLTGDSLVRFLLGSCVWVTSKLIS